MFYNGLYNFSGLSKKSFEFASKSRCKSEQSSGEEFDFSFQGKNTTVGKGYQTQRQKIEALDMSTLVFKIVLKRF